ncbi:MAG TPA: hypothetical protein VFU02_23810 [Polyangiaceae bacterium]|nr:hypothetical protein [Polyangiaceae bacterium]
MKQRRRAWGIFLGALLLLVLNDCWFKSSGFMPHWLTGKLSDVTGLIVAPVTLALLVARRSPRIYRASFGLVALIFGAVELSTECADLLVRGLGVLGLSWTLWPDPTDLLALLVLPVAWRVSMILTAVGPIDRSRLIAVPAAAACLASGNMPVEMDAAMFVYNGTDRVVVLNVASVPWLECAALEQFGDALIESGDFGVRELVRLAPRAAFPLRNAGCGCGLYRLSVGGRSTAVRVPDGSIRIDRHPTAEQRRRHGGRMLVIGEDFSFFPGQAVQTVDVPAEAETADCGPEPAALAYTAPWLAAFSFNVVDMELLAVEPVAGNCFGVTLQRASLDSEEPGDAWSDGGAAGASGTAVPGAAGGGAIGAAGSSAVGAAGGAGEGGVGGVAGSVGEVAVPLEPFRLHLCAPIELFPFTVGDVVAIDETRAEGSGAINVRTNDRRFTLRVGEPPASHMQSQAESCGPLRDENRAPFVTVPVVAGSGFTQLLAPGEVRSFEEAGGRLDVYLGRSRRMLGCASEQPGKVSVEIAERWSL